MTQSGMNPAAMNPAGTNAAATNPVAINPLGPQRQPPQSRPVPIALFACLTLIDTTVFLLDKVASQHASTVGHPFYWKVVTQPWIYLAFALGPLQLFIWNRILKRVDLSLAYPLSTTSYLATMLVAQFIFKESLGPRVWIGAMLITAGVAVLGRSDQAKSPAR